MLIRTLATAVVLISSAVARAQEGSAAAPTGLSTGGWIFMGISLVFVCGLTLWCFARVLSRGED